MKWCWWLTRFCVPCILTVAARGSASGESLVARGEARLVPAAMSVAAPSPDPDDVYWDSGFQPPFGNWDVKACAVDSNGILYAGGEFTEMGGTPARGIAKWDGQAWSPVGEGLGPNAWVYALAIDGTDVYAGGLDLQINGGSPTGIARWDGSAWTAVGEGLVSMVLAIEIGAGKVYAGGSFQWSGSTMVNRIAEWDGVSWSTVGGGVTDWVTDLAVSGSDVYASGFFWEAGGVPVDGLAKWNGSTWSEVGGKTGGGAVEILDGDLYLARSGGVDRWDGSIWEPLGTGMNGEVTCLGAGNGLLYAGGAFTTAGGVNAEHIAAWDGANWVALGDGMESDVNALETVGDVVYAGFLARVGKYENSSWSLLGSGFVDDPGTNTEALYAVASSERGIYIGGRFQMAGGIPARNIVHWDGVTWSPLGDGVNFDVRAIYVQGEDVYVGGNNWSGGTPADPTIVRWDGSAWQFLGDGVDGLVYSLAGDGTNLYVGGTFSTAGGNPANSVARWDGANWHALGDGIEGYVYDMVFSGGNLYAGGYFLRAGTQDAEFHNMARWNGSTWELVVPGVADAVNALAADEAGNIHAGGEFSSIGGVPMGHIARWDGSEWSPLGEGTSGSVGWVEAREGRVYAGGYFLQAGGQDASGIAVWDGVGWSGFGSGVGSSHGGGVVYAGAITGDALLAGGIFREAGGKTSWGFARWMPRVNVDSLSYPPDPGAVTLGNNPHGFYKPALITESGTTVQYSGGLPVDVTMEQAEEIHVNGVRVNGAFTVNPSGVRFGGSGATMRVEFSEDDVASFGAAAEDFRIARLGYPADYPTNKEAVVVEFLQGGEPYPIRIQNGRRIYAIEAAVSRINSTYGAVPFGQTGVPAHLWAY